MKLLISFLACAGQWCEPVSLPTYDMSEHFCTLRGGQMVAAGWIARNEGFSVVGRVECKKWLEPLTAPAESDTLSLEGDVR